MKKLILLICFLLLECQKISAVEAEVLSTTPHIVVYHGFLTHKECDYIVKSARPYLTRSTVVDDKSSGGKIDQARTSEGMFFPYNHEDPIILAIERKISLLAQLPQENGENIQVLHYIEGAEYRPHFDFFDPTTIGGQAHLKRGGQRVATFIMYLNTPKLGGETIFPLVDVKVIPKKGDAVLFYNSDFAGHVDRLTLHGGAPVLQGEKWIATRWLRQYVFK